MRMLAGNLRRSLACIFTSKRGYDFNRIFQCPSVTLGTPKFIDLIWEVRTPQYLLNVSLTIGLSRAICRALK